MNNKKNFLNNLLRIISENNGVISVTHVGSFLEKDLSEISDIDIVVIVNSLTPDNYEKLNRSVSDFNISKYFPEYKILLNSTFGPLKIMKENTLVIHLMIYSLTDHQKHTIESPFTTLDWERSNNIYKKSLSSLSKNKIALVAPIAFAIGALLLPQLLFGKSTKYECNTILTCSI